jgi:hypothetical protein
VNSSSRVTGQQLQELLTSLGFVGTTRDDGSTVYHHARAGSLILLPAIRGNGHVRAADIVSVGRHLVGRGHLEEEAFDAFVEAGVVPENVSG